MREIPYSNYPPGVDDGDPYFSDTPDYDGPIRWQPERPKPIEPHAGDCTCEECSDCPF